MPTDDDVQDVGNPSTSELEMLINVVNEFHLTAAPGMLGLQGTLAHSFLAS